jgi:hypothetical protein
MARDIQPLSSHDIPELSLFLTAGFDSLPEADYTAPEVLRWKYLKYAGLGEPLSYIARDETGPIIGHLGLCRTAFEGRAITASSGQVPTIHIIDWLGSPDHRAVGISLMRKAHDGVATQFGLGVSQAALVVGERAGYELRGLVPAYFRVLRPAYWMRSRGSSLLSRGLHFVQDVVMPWLQSPTPPRATIVLERVSTFGSEIYPIVDAAKAHAILTQRNLERLNAILRFPRQSMTGWHLRDHTGALRGLALLNVIPKDQGRTRMGKIVDCLLDDLDINRWQAAIMGLTRELASQGADLAQAYASTPWTAEALIQSGYKSRFSVKFHIRDPQAMIPREALFHLTPLEGDYAYT